MSGVLEHKVIIQNDSVNNSWMNNKIQELDDKVNEMNLKRSRCEQELNNE